MAGPTLEGVGSSFPVNRRAMWRVEHMERQNQARPLALDERERPAAQGADPALGDWLTHAGQAPTYRFIHRSPHSSPACSASIAVGLRHVPCSACGFVSDSVRRMRAPAFQARSTNFATFRLAALAHRTLYT